MFLTVCPNTALDKILFIKEWTAGMPMRTERIVNSVGGKDLNSAVTLTYLGAETVSLGFFVGDIGKELVSIVEEYGIKVDAIWADGTNRIAHVIADKKNNEHSHVIAGKTIVNAAQKQEFLDRFRARLSDTEYIILAGTVPESMNQDLYAELIPIARDAGIPALVDAHGEVMRAAVTAVPDIVKMNWEEFEFTFDKKAETIESLIQQAGEFYKEKNLKNLVITMSKEGILAFTPDGTFLAKAPPEEPLNAAGAGDSVSSTLAFRLSRDDDWGSVLRWSCAVSAATVLTERTGDVFQEDIERILPQVSIKKL